MPPLVVGLVNIKNQNFWRVYVEDVRLSLEPYDAEVKFRGKNSSGLAGKKAAQQIVIIEFESIDKIKAWYSSMAYQALIPLRDKAADVTITIYEDAM